MTSPPPSLSDALYLRRYGHGPRRLLGLHGWAADHTTFEALAQQLPPDRSLYALDLPGYGRSAPLARWSFDDLKPRLHRAILDMGPGPIELIGSCSGAIIGLACLHEDAQELGITRMHLLEPFAFVPAYLGVFLVPVLGHVAYWSTFANPLGRKLTDLAMSRQQVTQDHTTQSSFAKVDPWVPYHYLRMMSDLGSAQRFSHLRLPTHLIHGQRTFGAIRDSIAIWRALWPHALDTQVQDAGHMLIQERPEQVASLLCQDWPAPPPLDASPGA